MAVDHQQGAEVPVWLLDTDHNGLVFRICQAYFPRTSASDSLNALKDEFENSVWDQLSGATSAPFEPGEHKAVEVNVSDDRGAERMVARAS
jgi:adenine-specific DNA-methyltransferase